eukprot:CAMPEP_0205925060 /NCGR_PEP_ID=MMETSP1325-20131115/17335_1 /ASSEMBLY_ACC=CAM_ASM_000708 /TAXON_ID=236786 /ORGANISM="Florenciella sp., Strain RCC1007" /LENGTH=134 /DNA_ID=CAMNT_0053293515 /DNA_START=68 /DNA_END=472 /DNA_ORIENTATION=-
MHDGGSWSVPKAPSEVVGLSAVVNNHGVVVRDAPAFVPPRICLSVERLAEFELRTLYLPHTVSHAARVPVGMPVSDDGTVAIGDACTHATAPGTVIHIVSFDRLVAVEALRIICAVSLWYIVGDRPVAALEPVV